MWQLLPVLLAAQGPAVPDVAAQRAAWAASVPAACGPASQRALPLLDAGDKASARGNARAATKQMDAGLQALGNAYYRRAMGDDTGMRLILASTHERKGRFARAAATKRRVLVERLSLCGVSISAKTLR